MAKISEELSKYLGLRVETDDAALGKPSGKDSPYGIVTTRGIIADVHHDDAKGDYLVMAADEPGTENESVALPEVTVKRKRGSKKTAAAAPQPEPQVSVQPVRRPVRVEVTVGALGTIPSQYTFCGVGNRVAVLGLNEFSFTPAIARATADGIDPVVSLDEAPGRQFVYLGQKFSGPDDKEYIVLNEITKPGGASSDDQER